MPRKTAAFLDRLVATPSPRALDEWPGASRRRVQSVARCGLLVQREAGRGPSDSAANWTSRAQLAKRHSAAPIEAKLTHVKWERIAGRAAIFDETTGAPQAGQQGAPLLAESEP